MSAKCSTRPHGNLNDCFPFLLTNISIHTGIDSILAIVFYCENHYAMNKAGVSTSKFLKHVAVVIFV